MSEEKKSKIEALGLDEALEDLKFLAQKVSDMSKDLAERQQIELKALRIKWEILSNQQEMY